MVRRTPPRSRASSEDPHSVSPLFISSSSSSSSDSRRKSSSVRIHYIAVSRVFLPSAIVIFFFNRLLPSLFSNVAIGFSPKTFRSFVSITRAVDKVPSHSARAVDIPTAVRGRPGGVLNKHGNVRSNINAIPPPPPPSPVAAAAATCGGYTCGGIGGRRRRAHHPHHHQQHHHHRRAGGLGVPHVAGDANRIDRRPDRRGAPSTATNARGTEETATAATTTMASSSGGSKWAWRPRRPRWTAGVHGLQSSTLMLAAVTLAMLLTTAVQVTVYVIFNLIVYPRAHRKTASQLLATAAGGLFIIVVVNIQCIIYIYMYSDPFTH